MLTTRRFKRFRLPGVLAAQVRVPVWLICCGVGVAIAAVVAGCFGDVSGQRAVATAAVSPTSQVALLERLRVLTDRLEKLQLDKTDGWQTDRAWFARSRKLGAEIKEAESEVQGAGDLKTITLGTAFAGLGFALAECRQGRDSEMIRDLCWTIDLLAQSQIYSEQPLSPAAR